MKRTQFIIGIIVIIIAFVTYSFFTRKTPSILPPTFTITTHGDFTSSGGDRSLDETYTFKSDILTTGSATWISEAGGGCTENCKNTEQCVITDNQWVEVQKWQGCETQFGPVPTKQSIEAKIKSGELKPKTSATEAHGYYYELRSR